MHTPLRSQDIIDIKLVVLILRKYTNAEDINSNDFRRGFEDEFYPYTYDDAQKILVYLHRSGYLEPAPGKYETLRITEKGNEKYKIEAAALGRRALSSGRQRYTTAAEKEVFALTYVPKLFPYFPDFVPFQINDAIKAYAIAHNIPYEDTLEIKSIDTLLQHLLVSNGYAERSTATHKIQLTAAGRQQKRTLHQPVIIAPDNRHFDVALSFPGEVRPFIEEVVRSLQDRMDTNQIFYDEFYQAFLARPSLDVFLGNLYRHQARLIVVFLSQDYQQKPWPGLEFRSIREIIFENKAPHKIMYIRMDDAKVDGVLSTDGYIDARKHTPTKIAEFILQRLTIVQ